MPEIKPTQRRIALLFLLCVLSGTAGCKDRNITTYRIPKEAEDAAVPAPGADSATPATQAPARWETPAGWKSQPATGMRLASFLVSGFGGATADISIITFPGTGGDDLANINRWRNQLQLAPISAGALAGELQTLDAAAGRFVVADMTGAAAGTKPATRILGAWLRDPERVWFFKIMGPADLVGAQRDAFGAFLKSFELSAGAGGGAPLVKSGGAPANTNDLPPGHPVLPPEQQSGAPGGSAAMDAIPVQAADTPSLRWRAPADWKTKPGSAMRKGSYAAGDAEIAITAFPGDVGGVLANINRWRGQVGLPPVSDSDLGQVATQFDSNGLHFVVIDAAGSSSRIVAALLPWQGSTWFFKLTGPGEPVGRAKPAFLEFLKTVQAP